MHRQARDLKGSLQQQVAAVLDGGPRRGLAALAFLVVVREGLETALLLFGAAETSSPTTMLFGSLLGLTAAAGLGYAIYRGALRLDLRAFFNTTGILLVFFAAGMLASSVHEFIEVGLLPGICRASLGPERDSVR